MRKPLLLCAALTLETKDRLAQLLLELFHHRERLLEVLQNLALARKRLWKQNFWNNGVQKQGNRHLHPSDTRLRQHHC